MVCVCGDEEYSQSIFTRAIVVICQTICKSIQNVRGNWLSGVPDSE